MGNGDKTPPARIVRIRAQRRWRGGVRSGFFAGGGTFTLPGVCYPFASVGRTGSTGGVLDGEHGSKPKNSRTKLAEKNRLKNPGRRFCRLGKEKLSFRQKCGARGAFRSYGTDVFPDCALRQLVGETPSRALKIRVKWLGETKPAASAILAMFCPGCPSMYRLAYSSRRSVIQ